MNGIRSVRTQLGYVLRLVISVGLLSWMFIQSNPADMFQTWKELDWARLLPSVILIHLFCTAIRTLRLAVILSNLGISISLLWLWLSHLRSNFVTILLPGNLAGDIYRAIALARSSQQGLPSISAIAIERISGVAAMSVLALAGLAYGAYRIPLPYFSNFINSNSAIWLLSFVGACALAIVWLTRSPRALQHVWFQKLASPVQQVSGYFAYSLLNAYELGKLLSISLLFQLGIVGWYFAIARAMGIEVSLPLLIVIIPLVELLLLLPISIGGIGVREAAFSVLLVPLGLAQEEAISFALLSFTLLTFTRILSGLAFLLPYESQVRTTISRDCL